MAADTLNMIAFETSTVMLREGCKQNVRRPVASSISASVFGRLPKFGANISEITLVKNVKEVE